MNTLVSVIIPVYNHGQYLDEAVDSVLASSYENLEIIIINDGSTDQFTNELLKNYKKPKTIVIHQENKGVSSARNAGIEIARGEYILPLDSDDKIHKDYIKKAVAILDESPSIGIVYCQADLFGLEKGRWNLPNYSFDTFLNGNCIFVSSLYRKSDWKAVGGYKSQMKQGLEDWEFFISLIERDIKVVQIPEVLFYYRKTQVSRSTKINRLINASLYKQVFKLHTNFYAKHIDKAYPFFRTLFYDEIRNNKVSLFQRIFSIKYKNGYKILRILGFKIKLNN